jgi:hypothetical protein
MNGLRLPAADDVADQAAQFFAFLTTFSKLPSLDRNHSSTRNVGV